MKEKHEFRKESVEQQQAASCQQQHTEQTVIRFDSPEEMLRHDAQETEVPGRIEERLRQSVAGVPSQAEKGWWRRFFGA